LAGGEDALQRVRDELNNLETTLRDTEEKLEAGKIPMEIT